MDEARSELLARFAADIDRLVTKPLYDHIAEHGCGQDRPPYRAVLDCPTGRALYEATPKGHLILIA